MRLPLPFALAMIAAGQAASEPRTANPFGDRIAVERHFTSNAHDSPDAVADWYTLLRGTLADEWVGRSGTARIATQFQLTRYDRLHIEDDRSVAVTVEATRRIGERFELRGTVAYGLASEGDDLPFGPFRFGTRTLTQSVAAEAQLGVDLGGETTLVLAVAEALQRPALSDIAPPFPQPLRLKPARDRLAASATLARALGPVTLGLVASIDLVDVEAIGWPPASLSYSRTTLMAQAASTTPSGLAVTVAAGVQTMRSAFALFEGRRPTYLVSIAAPVRSTVDVTAQVTGASDDSDTDDPMASWVQRAETTVTWRARETLDLGAGLFAAIKENPLLQNREHVQGFHLTGAWRFSRRLTLTARTEYGSSVATVIGVRQATLDTAIGISAGM
ncbi:MAG: hypothetical protein KF723_06535 [Rhizobiaceae bacterium]|nr:hypothetical protein [Rhizobiaceae bacterium]